MVIFTGGDFGHFISDHGLFKPRVQDGDLLEANGNSRSELAAKLTAADFV